MDIFHFHKTIQDAKKMIMADKPDLAGADAVIQSHISMDVCLDSDIKNLQHLIAVYDDALRKLRDELVKKDIDQSKQMILAVEEALKRIRESIKKLGYVEKKEME